MIADQRNLARGKQIVLLRDVATQQWWGVVVLYRGEPYFLQHDLTKEEAQALVDEQLMLPGPEGDSGLLAVMARVYGCKAPPGMEDRLVAPWNWAQPSREEIGRLAYANHFFEISSWNWLVTLVDLRRVG